MDEIIVVKLTEKHGKTNGKTWVRYGVKDETGAWYSTFSKSLVACLREGEKARIRYISKPLGGRVLRNLVAAEPVE